LEVQLQHDQLSVDPQESLFVTARKRFVPVYNTGPGGTKELTLYCGLQEISFDEPELFPWAEKLIQQDSFKASASTSWSTTPLEWPRVKELLESLLEAGLLAREASQQTAAQTALSAAHYDFLEREQARPATGVPRWWSPDPTPIFEAITGRGLPVGFLESIVPVHRLAHIALDREGRQVGEANSFPDRMRLKVPTEYKTCGYAGTRYMDEMPMNMTALRSMLAHWRPVLAATLACRAEFLKRYPQYPDGRWKLGDVLFMTSGVLALPAIQMLRWRAPVQNGELDPVLSSLFRVIDGVRMVAGHMLDLYERPMVHDTPVMPQDITAAAEREDQYRSGKGVCAGPQAMIDELVQTVIYGKPLGGEPPVLGPWAADIPKALDYALLGRAMNATVATIWVAMGGAYARMYEAFQREPKPSDGLLGKLRVAVERDFLSILPGRNDQPEQRAWSYPFHKTSFERAQLGITGLAPQDRVSFDVVLHPPAELLGESAGAMRDLFASLEEPAHSQANGALLQELGGYLLDYLRFERNALRTVSWLQRQINALLERPQPVAPFTNKELGLFHSIRQGTPGAAVYILDPFKEALGLEVDNREEMTTVAVGGRTLALR
jgi:hypothetical protein